MSELLDGFVSIQITIILILLLLIITSPLIFLLGDENCSLDAENSVSKKASTLSSGNSSPSGGYIQPPEHPKLGFLS